MSHGRSNRRAMALQACDPLKLFQVPPAVQIVMWGALMPSKCDVDDDEIEGARYLCQMRLPRTCATYQFSGAFLDCVDIS
jgi:hypothetical protein